MNRKSCIGFFLSFVLLLAFVIFAGTSVVEAAVYSYYPWVTMNADAQRTGFTQSPGPGSNESYWKFQTGGPITSSPVVAEGKVFLSSNDGNLYAINATTGVEVWSSQVGTSPGSPTCANDRVFVASSGKILAFDAATGEVVWNQTLGEVTSQCAPLVVGSRLFVASNSTVFALNEEYGVRLYYDVIPHGNGIRWLTYTDGLVVAAATRNETGLGLHGFEAINTIGRFWMFLEPSGKDRYSDYLINETTKIFAAVEGFEGNNSAFGVTQMGMIMWERQIEGLTNAFPATGYNTTYIPTSKHVYALNASDGSIQWARPTSGAESESSPAVADGRLYFGLDDGYIYALDAFNGDLIWKFKTDGPVRSSPAISDGLLFVGSDDGCLYAIGYPKLQTFSAETSDGAAFDVTVESSAAVTNFRFDQTPRSVSFEIANNSETTSFLNVTFPSNLLNATFSVVNQENQTLPFEVATNQSHSSLSFNTSQGTSRITIMGTEAIPEFPSWAVVVAILCVVTGAMIMYKKSFLSKNSELRRKSK